MVLSCGGGGERGGASDAPSGSSQSCDPLTSTTSAVRTWPPVGTFTAAFTPETSCSCSTSDTSCHALYQGRIDAVSWDGWHADLSFMKANGSIFPAGLRFWVVVGAPTPSCVDLMAYVSAARVSGMVLSDIDVLSVPDVDIWPNQTTYAHDQPGTTKSLFLVTDGAGSEGIPTWFQKDGLLFTK
jgi:hypothetical protein